MTYNNMESRVSFAETKKSFLIKNQKAKTVFFNLEML